MHRIFFILLAAFFVVSCEGNQTVAKPSDNGVKLANQVPAETKDSEIPSGSFKDMYCITNNVIVFLAIPADNILAYYDPYDSSLKAPEVQLMKYDRVKMIEVKDGWARVEWETSRKDTQKTQKETGWVLRSTLDEWKVNKFFEVKDNVFTTKKPIPLFENSQTSEDIEEIDNSVSTISRDDTYRVLKGNGERFYIVSKSGSSGWANSENIDVRQLVAKRFNFKNKESFEVKPSSIQIVDGKPVVYEILPEDMADKAMQIGEFNLVPKFFNVYGEYPEKGIYINQDDQEVNINAKLGVRLKPWFEKINGEEYKFSQKLLINFYGMVALIDIGVPQKYIDSFAEFYSKILGKTYRLGGGIYLRWNQYEKLVEYINNKGKFEEIVRIRLYTRDVRLIKIKDFVLKGSFAFNASIENLKEVMNTVDANEEGLTISLGVAENGVLLDDLPDMDEGFTYTLYPDYTGTNFFSGRRYVIKPKLYKLHLDKKDLDQGNLKAIDLKDKWCLLNLNNKKSKPSNSQVIINKVGDELKINSTNRSDYFIFNPCFIDKYNITAVSVINRKASVSYIFLFNTRNEIINRSLYKYRLTINNIYAINDHLIWRRSTEDGIRTELFSGVNNEY